MYSSVARLLVHISVTADFQSGCCSAGGAGREVDLGGRVRVHQCPESLYLMSL